MPDSRHVVSALHEVDPGFTAVCKAMFGEEVDADTVWYALYGPSRDALSLFAAARQEPYSPLAKAMPDQSTVSTPKPLVAKPSVGKSPNKRAAGSLKPVKPVKPVEPVKPVAKRDDVVWTGTFAKYDDEKRLAFGWANVTSIGGETVLDKQGDIIFPDEMEKAAYDYVQRSRIGGNMHKRTDDGSQPHHVMDLVESFVVTPEKIEKMGLPPDTPQGWWVGFKIHDDEAWDDVKSQRRTSFSIHGRGRRTPVEV